MAIIERDEAGRKCNVCVPVTVGGLRAFRSRHLLALREIATQYGASKAQISRLLHEHYRIRPGTLERLRRAFALALQERRDGAQERA